MVNKKRHLWRRSGSHRKYLASWCLTGAVMSYSQLKELFFRAVETQKCIWDLLQPCYRFVLQEVKHWVEKVPLQDSCE